MIPIHSIEDVTQVKDPVLRNGLYKEFKRLPDDFIYPDYGFFIIIETPEELEGFNVLAQIKDHFTLPPYTDYIELIEPFRGYSQIVCLLDADFGVSLFVSEELMPLKQVEALLEDEG